MSDLPPRKIKVQFTEQQIVFLEKVRAEGTFGESMEEVVLTLFREQAKTMVPQSRD